MRFIFLDFDGVLNSAPYIYSHNRDNPIDPIAVARLNKIVERTGAKVVISSSWRIIYNLIELQDVLLTNGFVGRAIGTTPNLPGNRERGDEIQRWMDTMTFPDEVESFVILDDNSDMAHLRHRLVQTSFEQGLTDEDVERAVKMLETRI